jgi:hypothetical protein
MATALPEQMGMVAPMVTIPRTDKHPEMDRMAALLETRAMAVTAGTGMVNQSLRQQITKITLQKIIKKTLRVFKLVFNLTRRMELSV